MPRILLLFFLFSLVLQLPAQENKTLPVNRELIKLLDSTRKVKDDSLRIDLNRQFFEKLNEYVLSNKDKELNFDSISISNQVSDDGNIRILSWNIQQNNRENIYSGLIIRRNPEQIIPLRIMKSEPTIPEDKIFRDGDWPSGIIYRIIQRKYEGKVNYTLLIWDGFSQRTSRKSIEALSFDSQEHAVFGAPVFKTKEGVKMRIVIEYSASASFSLQYNRQKVTLSGVRRSRSKVDDEMIVFDRLMPLNEDLKGQRWAYVPVGNINDAFIYFDGFWTMTENISARNEATPQSGFKNRKPIELDLIPKDKK